MRAVKSLAIAALIGCASRPTPPPLAPDSQRLNEVVATFDGDPVTLGDVLDASLEIDRAGMLRRYFLKRAIDKRRRELGIENTPDELLRFARAQSERRPEEFERAVRASQKIKEDYLNAYAQSPGLGARLVNEKIVAYSLLTEDARRISLFQSDRPVFNDTWIVRGMLEKDFGRAVEDAAFRAPSGTVVPAASGYDIRVLEILRGVRRPYAEIASEVWAAVLSRALNDVTLEAHLDWLLGRADIRVLRK